MEARVSKDEEKLAATDSQEVVEDLVSDEGIQTNEAELEALLESVSVDASEQADTKNWQLEAETLAAQVNDLTDQAMRAKADAQNARRRAEQDVEKAHKFALEKFAKELLPIIDGLEKAVEAEVATGNEMTTLREGVEMTLGMFLSSVQKFQLAQVDPVGHPFDPALHEAMAMVDAPDSEPNTVIAAMQKGYTLNGRLIRPAMVMVSKGSSKVDQQA